MTVLRERPGQSPRSLARALARADARRPLKGDSEPQAPTWLFRRVFAPQPTDLSVTRATVAHHVDHENRRRKVPANAPVINGLPSRTNLLTGPTDAFTGETVAVTAGRTYLYSQLDGTADLGAAGSVAGKGHVRFVAAGASLVIAADAAYAMLEDVTETGQETPSAYIPGGQFGYYTLAGAEVGTLQVIPGAIENLWGGEDDGFVTGGGWNHIGYLLGLKAWEIVSAGAVWNRVNCAVDRVLDGPCHIALLLKAGTSGKAQIRIRDLTGGGSTIYEAVIGEDMSMIGSSGGTLEKVHIAYFGDDIYEYRYTFTPAVPGNTFQFAIGAGSSVVGETAIYAGMMWWRGDPGLPYLEGARDPDQAGFGSVFPAAGRTAVMVFNEPITLPATPSGPLELLSVNGSPLIELECFVPGMSALPPDFFRIESDTTNGSTTFTDSGPDGLAVANTGVVHSTAQQKVGATAMQFAETGDFLQVDTVMPIGTDDFTYTCWVYPQTTGATRVFLSRNGSGAINFNFEIQNGGGLGLWVGGPDVYMGGGSVPDDQWSFIALVRAGGVFKGYINGVEVFSQAAAVNYDTGSTFIGQNQLFASLPYKGFIDDVRFFAGALTVDQIIGLYLSYPGVDGLLFGDGAVNTEARLVAGGAVDVTGLVVDAVATAWDPDANEQTPFYRTPFEWVAGSTGQHNGPYADAGDLTIATSQGLHISALNIKEVGVHAQSLDAASLSQVLPPRGLPYG